MLNKDLIKKLKYRNPNLRNYELENIVRIFCECIKFALKIKKKLKLEVWNFFVKRIKEKYSARNPKTGELIYVPEKNKIRSKVSKNLGKKLMNKKFL